MLRKSFFSIILVFFLASILLTSCSPTRNDLETGIGGFLGGSEGLVPRVMEGAPPSVIMDRGLAPFSVIVPLENAGEAPVGPGTDNPLILVRLAGILHRNFGLAEQDAAKTLNAKLEPAKKNFDGTVLPGEINYVTFDNMAYQSAVYESVPLTIRAEACYDYESYATVKFCMKKDVLESWEDASICTLRGPRPFGNSGSPIHITNVFEAPIANSTVQINFAIEHFGRGIFFYRGAYKDLFSVCDFSEMNPDIYKLEVFVEPIEKDTYKVDCVRLDTPIAGGGDSGVIRMYEGAPLTVSCFISRTRPTSVRVYQDLLKIKLRYRYGEFVEIPILVQSHP
jgi:hypothetical protein